ASNGLVPGKAATLADAIRAYNVNSGSKLSFIEPRGLVNTGNMCYMNSILQILVFCVPFYDFLDQIGKRAAHSFKSDTPLLDAMIMFMREFPVIDSAVSVEQLRMRLKDNELEQYGEAFIPEYVYDVIKRLPRFSSMRRGHQQDAEEFLGFLLEGLHDECTHVLRALPSIAPEVNEATSPTSERSVAGSADGGWMEVGPKQKASITRSSGHVVSDSPITKIFGGNLRSELRVPGLKNSVTLEPYQPLQLDIGAPNVHNITDALKGLTRSETLQGDFNSPRGPGTSATKQVFIETLPPVLILHLKRFQYDNAGGTQKIWKRVGYPLELELPKEVFPPNKRNNLSMRGGLPRYRLTGVVYHHGKNAGGGHYTVDVRRQEGREWIRLDDTVIRRVRSDEVAEGGAEEDPKVLAAALENHKQDIQSGNIFDRFDEEDGEKEEDGQGWSQVNGTQMTPTGTAGKKWSGVVNGTNTGTATPSTKGERTPKGKEFKADRVAYILIYSQIKAQPTSAPLSS
ncbi:cysteine proteinase, partial [Rhizodiscina lignyota]